MATDWAGILSSVLADKGSNALKESKAVKKAVKQASKSNGLSAEALRASLLAFLSSGHGGFKLDSGKVVKEPVPATAPAEAQKHRRMKQTATAVPLTRAQPAAATALEQVAGDGTHKEKTKKKKRKAEADGTAAAAVGQQEQQQQQQAEPARSKKKNKDSSEQKAKGSKKRRAGGEEAAGPEARDQQNAQPPASPQQQQGHVQDQPGEGSQPPSKRRRKAASGSQSGAAAEGEAPAPARAAFSGGDDLEPSAMPWAEDYKRQDVKSGPFSKAEKGTLRQAVHDYAVKNGLGTDSHEWLFATTKNPATKGAWKQIAAALPQRTIKAVWAAGTRMFHEGNYQGKWPHELDRRLLQLVDERGRKWKSIGGALGRMPETCRDRWLAIRQGEQRNTGRWSQEETQRLKDAVDEYQEAKRAAQAGEDGGDEMEAMLTLTDTQPGGSAASSPQSDGGGGVAAARARRMVLDDIDWNVISQRVGTRSNIQCLEKWYDQVSPSMVARGEWGGGDDRRLLRALHASGASYDYELDWDALVRGRTAQQAKRRWRLMVKTVPDNRDLEFPDLVDALVDKYMPQLKEQDTAGAAGAAGAAGDGAGQE